MSKKHVAASHDWGNVEADSEPHLKMICVVCVVVMSWLRDVVTAKVQNTVLRSVKKNIF